MKIETARRLDALPTLVLHRDVIAEERYFVTRSEELYISLEQREREIEMLNTAENSCFLVARLPQVRVAGFVIINGGGLSRTYHTGRLELMVDASYRGQGLGKGLLDAAISRARDAGALRKISLVVLADNTRAVDLYRSRGFIEEGRRVAEYREADGSFRDDLLLALQLPVT